MAWQARSALGASMTVRERRASRCRFAPRRPWPALGCVAIIATALPAATALPEASGRVGASERNHVASPAVALYRRYGILGRSHLMHRDRSADRRGGRRRGALDKAGGHQSEQPVLEHAARTLRLAGTAAAILLLLHCCGGGHWRTRGTVQRPLRLLGGLTPRDIDGGFDCARRGPHRPASDLPPETGKPGKNTHLDTSPTSSINFSRQWGGAYRCSMTATLTVPLGVVVVREAGDNPWEGLRWRTVRVLMDPADTAGLRKYAGAASARDFHLATHQLLLERSEATSYQINLANGEPSVYVVLRHDPLASWSAPALVRSVTVSPFVARRNDPAHERVDRVAMPARLVSLLEGFVAGVPVEGPSMRLSATGSETFGR